MEWWVGCFLRGRELLSLSARALDYCGGRSDEGVVFSLCCVGHLVDGME